jgi:hypothetical protein
VNKPKHRVHGAALGYAHLVAPIYVPVLVLLAIMASIESGD